jgi:hypothetical protein
MRFASAESASKTTEEHHEKPLAKLTQRKAPDRLRWRRKLLFGLMISVVY